MGTLLRPNAFNGLEANANDNRYRHRAAKACPHALADKRIAATSTPTDAT